MAKEPASRPPEAATRLSLTWVPVHRKWMRLETWLEAKPKWAVYLMTTPVSFSIGWIDWVTNWELNLSLVYAVLVMFAAWVGGRNLGLAVAATSAVIAMMANWHSQPYMSGFGYFLANFNRIAFWSLMAIGMGIIRKRHDKDAEQIQMLEEMRQLELEIVSVSEKEQQRIGQDLHDGLCQELAAIGCAARALADDLQAAAWPEAKDAEKIGQALQDTVREARGLARGIFPVHIDRIGLSAALGEMAMTTERFTGVSIRVVSPDEAQVNDPEVARHLFRIAQEAVANAVKHGGAREVVVSVLPDGDHMELRVDDNGRGLPEETQAASHGMGLRTMFHRAHALGAELLIERRPGGGTSIRCRLGGPTHDTAHSYETH